MRCKTNYGKQKVTFETEKQAKDYLFMKSITYAGFTNNQKPYLCGCGKWHLTSKTEKQYQETVMYFRNKRY